MLTDIGCHAQHVVRLEHAATHGTQRRRAQALREKTFGCITQFIVPNILGQYNHRVGFDDALEKIDHAVDLANRLRFGEV